MISVSCRKLEKQDAHDITHECGAVSFLKYRYQGGREGLSQCSEGRQCDWGVVG